MRMTLIGPAFPWRGGIPLLVTDLAHRLTAAGHRVTLRTWTRQGPAWLLPAQRHPLATPESGVYPTVADPLSWRNPAHWRRPGAARRPSPSWWCWCTTPRCRRWRWPRSRGRPGRGRPGRADLRERRAARAPARRPRAAGRCCARCDAILVHTPAERAALARLTDRPVAVAALPPHLPAGAPGAEPDPGAPRRRLLFFGKIRPYKGVDVLLHALARIAGACG